MQQRLPGTAPAYLRLEALWEGEHGVTVYVTEAGSRTLVRGNETHTYGFLTWEEAAEVIGAVLDAQAASWAQPEL